MNENARTEAAEYFGLKVEVICRMEHCALVRFGGHECVVDAEDLRKVRPKETSEPLPERIVA